MLRAESQGCLGVVADATIVAAKRMKIGADDHLRVAHGRCVREDFRQIQAFQLVRKSKGTEATPSGWTPGKPVLKPGPDLVGKVWEVWSPKKG